jgi:hypothetical protein
MMSVVAADLTNEWIMEKRIETVEFSGDIGIFMRDVGYRYSVLQPKSGGGMIA